MASVSDKKTLRQAKIGEVAIATGLSASAGAQATGTKPPKPVKPSRSGGARSAAPKWRRRTLIAGGTVVVGLWLLPIALAWTSLRNQPIVVALSGINGTLSSRSASFGWFSPIVYNDVEIRDAAGNVVLTVAEIRSDRPLLHLATHPRNVGKFRLLRPELSLEMRPDGSNLEDVLAPLLHKDTPSSGGIGIGLEVVDGTINLHDMATDDRWRVDQYQTTLRLEPTSPLPAEWSLSGNVALKGGPAKFALAYLPTGSATTLALSPATDADNTAERVEAHIDPLPIAIFRSVLARVLPEVQIAGLLSADFQYRIGAADAPRQLQGQFQIDQLALSAAPLGKDVLRLASLKLPCQVSWLGREIDLKQLGIACDVGAIAVSGHTTLPENSSTRTLAQWLRESFDVKGNLDLAKLAALLPDTLHVRQSARITSGAVQLALSSVQADGAHRWTGQMMTSNITGVNDGRAVKWEQPVVVAFNLEDSAAGPVIEKLDCLSNFIHVTAAGTLDKFSADASCDLNQLAAELGQFLDLGDAKPAGDGRGTIRYERADDGSFQADASGEVRNFHLVLPGKKAWTETLLTGSLSVAGQIPQTSITQIDKASLDITSGGAKGATVDHLTIQLLEPLTNFTSLAAASQGRVQARLQGDLTRWQPRLAPLIDVSAWQLGGSCDLSATAAYSSKGMDIQDIHGVVQQLHACGSGWFIDEPTVEIKAAANWDSVKRTLRLDQPTLLSSTVSVTAKQVSLQMPLKGPATLQGTVTGQADLARLSAWTHDPRTPVGNVATGRLSGEANFTQTGTVSTANLAAAVDDLIVYAGMPIGPANGQKAGFLPGAGRPTQPAVIWQEKRLTLSAGGKYDRAADILKLDSLDVTSAALHAKGSGQISQLTGEQNADLKGQLDYDWQTMSGLLQPYLGSQVRFTGRQSRQFALRGPLAAAGSTDKADAYAWLKPLVVEGGIGWTTADVHGLKFGAAAVDARLADGTVSFIKPLEVALRDGQSGQFIFVPQLRFSPAPAQLLLGAGPLARQVRISQEMCGQWLKFVAPLVADASKSDGSFSLDLQGGRIPLADPTGGDVAGKLTIISAEIAPGPIVEPFAFIGQQLQALLQGKTPPLNPSSVRPLVNFSPQTVDFRLVNHRVYHDRIEMTIGGTVIRTRGSVGLADESLIMEAEVALRTTAPLIGGKQPAGDQQTIRIPISGTLKKPVLDPRAMEQLVAQVLKNGTRNLIRNGLDDIENLVRPGK